MNDAFCQPNLSLPSGAAARPAGGPAVQTTAAALLLLSLFQLTGLKTAGRLQQENDNHFQKGLAMPPPDLRLQRFTDFLMRSGFKATRQRERIVRAFFTADQHVSAEELHRRLKSERCGVGLVTVYRTLKLLREAGLAAGRQFGDTYTRFDPNAADRPHDHLICTRCGKIQEFEDPGLPSLRRKVARRLGFTVTEHKLELYGICRECARHGQADRTRRAHGAALSA